MSTFADKVTASAPAPFASTDPRRILHAVYRVGDLDKTLQVYEKAFGLKKLRERDVPEGKYKNVFLGFGDEREHSTLELTYNYGVESYDLGTAFGHFAIASKDIYSLAEVIKQNGGVVSREPGPVKGGKTHIAFAKDPTGWPFELIQREQESPEPLAQVMLRVGDLERSVQFYTRILGAKLIRISDNVQYQYSLAFLGFKGVEDDEMVFELTYNWGKGSEAYEKGDGYSHAAVGTDDVDKAVAEAKELGATVLKEPAALPGVKTRIGAVADPDGYKIVFVDNADFLKELEASEAA